MEDQKKREEVALVEEQRRLEKMRLEEKKRKEQERILQVRTVTTHVCMYLYMFVSLLKVYVPVKSNFH